MQISSLIFKKNIISKQIVISVQSM